MTTRSLVPLVVFACIAVAAVAVVYLAAASKEDPNVEEAPAPAHEERPVPETPAREVTRTPTQPPNPPVKPVEEERTDAVEA